MRSSIPFPRHTRSRARATLVAGILVVLLGGCGLLPRSAPARLHAVTLPAPTVAQRCAMPFSVRDLRLAGHLDRTEIVLERQGSRILAEGDDQWAAPLRAELPRAIGAALSRRLEGSRLVPHPWRFNEIPPLALSVDVERLEPEGGRLRASMGWLLTDPSDRNRTLAHGRFETTEAVAPTMDFGEAADAVADAIGLALGRFADEMAARIAADPANDAPGRCR